jgi:8-oxo-dGTP diphosphatase
MIHLKKGMVYLEVRQMATAFLLKGNKILMMKKSKSKINDTEFWSGLGGHLEPDELNYPKKACLREIFEESGIIESDIQDLTLRYILIRIKEQEIRQQFVYFGKSLKERFVQSNEGELSWVDYNEVLKLNLSKIIHFMLKHYFQSESQQDVIIGTITNSDHGPQIHWAELKDPKVF